MGVKTIIIRCRMPKSHYITLHQGCKIYKVPCQELEGKPGLHTKTLIQGFLEAEPLNTIYVVEHQKMKLLLMIRIMWLETIKMQAIVVLKGLN